MKKISKLFFVFLAVVAVNSCDDSDLDDTITDDTTVEDTTVEGTDNEDTDVEDTDNGDTGNEDTDVDGEESVLHVLYILNEGLSGNNNASLSVYDYESGSMTNNLFSTVNGNPLGDVGNDIIIADDKIIIALNSSSIIQFCDLEGNALAQTEDVASPRRLASDGEYLYVTSYANNGYVAKIDLDSYEVVGETNVGYEPEGIVCYDGRLYVANTGGYANSGDHGYENSISVIDAETMTETDRISTDYVNLYGGFIQNEKYPQYILVNASGDYYDNPAGSFVFDCETDSVTEYFDFPATYAAQYDGKFFSIGSSFSYVTYAFEYFCKNIDISSGTPVVSDGLVPLSASSDDSIVTAVKSMTAPYGIFIDSEGNVVISDADNYSNRGSVSIFSSSGELIAEETVGVIPGHFAEKL